MTGAHQSGVLLESPPNFPELLDTGSTVFSPFLFACSTHMCNCVSPSLLILLALRTGERRWQRRIWTSLHWWWCITDPKCMLELLHCFQLGIINWQSLLFNLVIDQSRTEELKTGQWLKQEIIHCLRQAGNVNGLNLIIKYNLRMVDFVTWIQTCAGST